MAEKLKGKNSGDLDNNLNVELKINKIQFDIKYSYTINDQRGHYIFVILITHTARSRVGFDNYYHHYSEVEYGKTYWTLTISDRHLLS